MADEQPPVTRRVPTTDTRYLSARLLQSVGVLLLLGSAIYWGVTGNQSSLFVGAAMSLIGIGAYQGVRVTVQLAKEEQPPAKETTP
jgi:hypothetical protein